MKLLKNEKGVTLVALAFTVIIILIIVGVTFKYGSDAIKTAKIETIITNMITIKAKGKGYVEEINAQIWDLEEGEKNTRRDSLFNEKFDMTKATIENEKINGNLIGESNRAYFVTKQTLRKMGLEELADNSEDDEYAIIFNLNDFAKFDVIYIDGVDYGNGTYWNLSTLQEALEDE